jgi:hypothetical protein
VDKASISDFALRVEQSEVVEQCTRVLSALFDYSRQSEKGPLLESCLLLQRSLLLQMWEHIGKGRSIFEQCKRISPAVLPRFIEGGVSSVDDVLNMSPKELQRLLKCSNEDVGSTIRYGKEMLGSRLVASATLVSKQELRIDVESAVVKEGRRKPPATHGSRVAGARQDDFTSHFFHLICYESETLRLLCYRKFSSAKTLISYTVTLSDVVKSTDHVVISLLCVDAIGLDFTGNDSSASSVSAVNGGGDGSDVDGRSITVVSPTSPEGKHTSTKASTRLYAYDISSSGEGDRREPYYAHGRGDVEDGGDGDGDEYESESTAETSRRKHLVQQKLQSSYFQPSPAKRKSSAAASATGRCDGRKDRKRELGSEAAGASKKRQSRHKKSSKREGGGQEREAATARSGSAGGRSKRGGAGAGASGNRGEDFGLFEYTSFRDRALQDRITEPPPERAHASYTGGPRMGYASDQYALGPADFEIAVNAKKAPTNEANELHSNPTEYVRDDRGVVSEDLLMLRRKASEVETSQSEPIKRFRSRLAAGSRPGASVFDLGHVPHDNDSYASPQTHMPMAHSSKALPLPPHNAPYTPSGASATEFIGQFSSLKSPPYYATTQIHHPQKIETNTRERFFDGHQHNMSALSNSQYDYATYPTNIDMASRRSLLQTDSQRGCGVVVDLTGSRGTSIYPPVNVPSQALYSAALSSNSQDWVRDTTHKSQAVHQAPLRKGSTYDHQMAQQSGLGVCVSMEEGGIQRGRCVDSEHSGVSMKEGEIQRGRCVDSEHSGGNIRVAVSRVQQQAPVARPLSTPGQHEGKMKMEAAVDLFEQGFL